MPDFIAGSRPSRCDTCGKPAYVVDLYCRVSEDYDGDGGLRSVDDQEFEGTEFVQNLGCCYSVGEVFKDPDLSGWNKKVVRPEFNACMVRLRRGQSDALWVYDISRFSRKPAEGEALIEAAERGHRLYSNNTEKDLRKAEDRKWFRSRLTDAEHESMQLGERVRRGKRLGAYRRGKRNARFRGFATMGLTDKPANWDVLHPGEVFVRTPVPIEIVQAEMDAIRVCARMMLAGDSNSMAFHYLNDAGHLTYTGNLWGHATFRQLMVRPSLAGYLTHKGQIIPDVSLPEPWALDRETWHAVQAVLGSRKRGPAERKYLLSGLMRCPFCGNRCQSKTGNKPKRRIYVCGGETARGGRPCGRVAVTADFADEVVGEATVARLSDERHRARLIDLNAAASTRRREVQVMIAQAEEVEVDLSAKLGAGRLSPDAYTAFMDSHLARLGQLRAERDSLPQETLQTVAAEEAGRQWADAESDLALRRQMVREAFPNLTLLPATRGRNILDPLRFDFEGLALERLKSGVAVA